MKRDNHELKIAKFILLKLATNLAKNKRSEVQKRHQTEIVFTSILLIF